MKWHISNLLNRFKPNQSISVVKRESMGLRLSEWRKEEMLLSSAARIWRDPDFRLMLDVLENEHPAKIGMAIDHPIQNRAVLHAIGQGYQTCLNNLKLLQKKIEKKQDIPETYADSNALDKAK